MIHKPFQIPSLESVALSTEILDRYVGTYVAQDAPVKATITREGTTLYFRPPNSQNTAPLEATAENKFKIEPSLENRENSRLDPCGLVPLV